MTLRRSHVPLLTMLAAYSYLFYQQSAGINFLLFSLLLIALLWAQQSETLSDAVLPQLNAIKEDPAYSVSPTQKRMIENRSKAFLRQAERQSWQSWNYDGQRVEEALNGRR